jgi:MtaA/CmuA family methyltransferase
MMTSLERVMTVISGGIPDRVPTDLHNFLMAARTAGIPLAECMQSGKLLAESQIVAWRVFKHDMLLVENGTATLGQAMGCGVLYANDAAPLVIDPVLKILDDLNELRLPDPEKDQPLPQVLKAVSILRREFGDRVFIMGRADQGPMALAAALRGYKQFFLDLGEEKNAPLIERLLDICVEADIRYAFALREAGAHGTSLGELGSDTISPTMYRRLGMPRLKKFYAAMQEKRFPASLHQCGNTAAVLSDMVSSGAAILELDPRTDLRAAKEMTRKKATVLGMVDPANVLERGTPALVREKSEEAIDILAPGGGFILGPGCALTPETPEANVMAMIESAVQFGRYRPDGTLLGRQTQEQLT